ncbi:MAG TPA: 3-deoxy-manno-octulosonate cytidylyltransferase [Flavipsychrobacter sp.]|nr:3-deoxy-manno-octulosonate cytidylyltransferase [Flavipsychrobacter sp.]
MKILGIIPARYASTRLPGKPLVDILGKTMIQRVYEQAKKAMRLTKVVVATDDERIAANVTAFGGEVVMTDANHPSGTDRCFEASQKLGAEYEYIINIQGDEPMIDPLQIDSLAAILNGEVELATLIKETFDVEELKNTGEVKVVMNTRNEALYFSRAIIPFIKEVPLENWLAHHRYFLHVGMYAYRKDILEAISKLSVSSLEKAESLEQLRWLEHGFKITSSLTDLPCYSVDTPDDLNKVIQLIQQKEAQ